MISRLYSVDREKKNLSKIELGKDDESGRKELLQELENIDHWSYNWLEFRCLSKG